MLPILLVDDDPIQLHVRETILRNAGLVVHIATSAEGALAVLRTMPQKIGVVVTDHLLPGRTGVELVRELRGFAPELPVLVLSGLPEVEVEYEGLDVEIRHKPFPPDQLIHLVRSLLPA